MYSLSGLATLGIGAMAATFVFGPDVVRPWVSLVAAIVGWSFVVAYSRKNWRSTYAGRAAMVMTGSVSLMLTNVAAVLWWNDGGYPAWEYVTTWLYVGVGLAITYKVGAMLRARGNEEQ